MISRVLMVALVLGSALSALPPNFDARDVWPLCLGPVYDQGPCNSSWAHAVASVVSDRYCIAKNIKVALSPQMLLSCVIKTCGGPFVFDPILANVTNPGLPTRECVPYKADDTLPCPTTCENNATFKSYPCKFDAAIVGVDNIKAEIMAHGPVVAAFTETVDYKDYYDGIYYHAHTKKNSFQTVVKLVGWGVENGIAYWIGQNSVGAGFGENGYVRYKMIDHELDTAYACTPPA